MPKPSVYFLIPPPTLYTHIAQQCTLDAMLWIYKPPPRLLLNKCSGMWAPACESRVLSFMSKSPKPYRCTRRESARKFSWGDAYSGGCRGGGVVGGLRPRILPAAHLPSGHLGFWEHCVQTAAFLPFKIWHKQQVKLLKSCRRCSSSRGVSEFLFLSVTSFNPVTQWTRN